jgi:mannose-6-phosphate isomerase-like protein (cupin superfamily)
MNIVEKPWGNYKDLERNPFRVVKIIKIFPKQRFSLQKHFKREEFWYILSGTGTITLDSETREVVPKNYYYIPIGCVHRLQAGIDGIEFLEIQQGDCDESDIQRIEDDYDRVTERL